MKIPRSPRQKRQKTLSDEVRSTYRILSITLTVLGILTTGSYLYLNTLKPAKGYELKSLQAEYEDLQSSLRKLNQEVTEAQSFANIEGSSVVNSMDKQNEQTSYTTDSPFAYSTQ